MDKESTPTDRETRFGGKRQTRYESLLDTSDEDEEFQPRSNKKVRIQSPDISEKLPSSRSSDDDGSVELIDPLSMTPKTSPQKPSSSAPLPSSAPTELADDEDEEDDVIVSSARRRRSVQNKLPQTPQGRAGKAPTKSPVHPVSSQIDEDLKADLEVLKKSSEYHLPAAK
jgi:hypothetical protein